MAGNFGCKAGRTQTHRCDLDGRTILGNLTYSYDADGRRTATAGSLATVTLPANVTGTTSYNADNEQSTFNGTSLSYDANGNLTGDGTNTYTWDARNHLTQITQRRTTVATFAYDAFGRRMNKTVNGTITQFVYDGLNSARNDSCCIGPRFRG